MLRRAAVALGLVAVLVPAACRKTAPPTPGEGAAATPLQLRKDGKYLFTYVDPAGSFVTVDDAAAVPPASRRMVRVVDPALAGEARDGTKVHVVDLDELARAGTARSRPVSREAFESGALAQLPPGQSSPRHGPRDPAPAGSPPDAGAEPGGPPVVIVYGTAWCGACRSARKYLIEKGIPFADKDVERDPAAARELAEKAARLGVPADRVPILDVRGRLLIGFDPARVQALLGDPA